MIFMYWVMKVYIILFTLLSWFKVCCIHRRIKILNNKNAKYTGNANSQWFEEKCEVKTERRKYVKFTKYLLQRCTMCPELLIVSTPMKGIKPFFFNHPYILIRYGHWTQIHCHLIYFHWILKRIETYFAIKLRFLLGTRWLLSTECKTSY